METSSSSRPKVLVTGCGGFIGYRLCQRLLETMEFDILGVDECNTFYDPNIKRSRIASLSSKDCFKFFESLHEINAYQAQEASTVLHLAGQASVSFCQEHPNEAYRCNEGLTKDLLCKVAKTAHVVFISSSSVYGDAPTPWSEDTEPKPRGVYANSKLRCEELVHERGAPATIIRPFSVIGKGCRPDLAPRKFLDKLLSRQVIEVFGDGSQRRDFTHVDDLVEVLIKAAESRARADDVRVYNVGSENPRSVMDVLDTLSRFTGRQLTHLVFQQVSKHEVHTTHAKSSRARNELGFHPRPALESGLQEIVAEPKAFELMVIVATKDRETLLRSRALPSIQKQTLQPSHVCVVVDEDPQNGATNLTQLCKDYPEYSFVYNSRTGGASGAWNTGVLHLTELQGVQQNCYVAVLDDDDEWERNHLEVCFSQVNNGITDWIISGIVRHADGMEQKQTIPDPTKLRSRDFIIGNPHVQGSNLFVSLMLFYRAGVFDEYLPSTTDRDLCICFFDAAQDLVIRTTRMHTVHHYADSNRGRLSRPASHEKTVGLQRFAYKHLRRVDNDTKQLFWKRADEVFAVLPLPETEAQTVCICHEKDVLFLAGTEAEEHYGSLLWPTDVTSLLFGVISDKPSVAAGLIQDIGSISNARLLLLANGHPKAPFQELLLKFGVPGEVVHYAEDRLQISQARTLLQKRCELIWKAMPSLDAVVIMDDDKRIPCAWFDNLRLLLSTRGEGLGGYLGPDIGAPPLPAAFTARTSLLDIFYARIGNHFCAQSSGGDPSLDGQDLFYDLSDKNSHHLEFPLPTILKDANDPMDFILRGIPLSRESAPNAFPEDYIERGGCCVIVRRELLSNPNPEVMVGGVLTRRSDMLWTIDSKHRFVKHPALSVYHDRTKDPLPSVEAFLGTAKQDILGSVLCRCKESRKAFLERRLKQLTANVLRIQGLLEAMRLSTSPYFDYSKWLASVICPVWNELSVLESLEIPPVPTGASMKKESIIGPDLNDFATSFREKTALRIVSKEFNLREQDLNVLGRGSEGVTVLSKARDAKYKVLDGYRPNETTYRGVIPGFHRKLRSSVLVCPFVEGKEYEGGHGPQIVKLLRRLKEEGRICFANWKPENVIVNSTGVHFIDYGRDVVAYNDAEFDHMVNRAFLSWRFPKHGQELKRLAKEALTHWIPHLDGVQYLHEAIEDTKPDRRLYDFVYERIKSVPHERVLDFGCGKKKFASRTQLHGIQNYDPYVDYPGVCTDVNDISGSFDLVVCLRVICVLSPEELNEALKTIRSRMTPHGRVFFSMCHPLGLDCDHCDSTFSFPKTVATGRTRTEWYRPLRTVRSTLARFGFGILKEYIFWQVDQHRFEKKPDQWCCLANLCEQPRHDLVIKTCLMEHATIEQRVHHLVETLPCSNKTMLVLDGKRANFLRSYDKANESAFKKVVARLLDEKWIDQLIEPPCFEDLLEIHQHWFCFTPLEMEDLMSKGKDQDGAIFPWTHDKTGVQYASTFHAFNKCSCELVLQVDSDLMVFSGPEGVALPYSLFDSDPLALTFALPIANHEASSLTTGHRIEVRGCLVHIPRLKAMFRCASLKTQIRETHWYRLVDQHLGEFRSYRGGQRFPFFVHPQNELKTDSEGYMLALDAVQSHRLHPLQVGRVDFVGMPTDKRSEKLVIVCCGRDVQAGRAVRCIDSIRRNMEKDSNIGLVVIDDASCRENVKFLRSIVPLDRTTFVSRRQRVGIQANLYMACSDLIENEDTIICTVDLDDALLGTPIPGIFSLYEDSPATDAAFGGMVHVDKSVNHVIDTTRPIPPREARGQPYWTHLRTFRKVLFDRIRVQDLDFSVEDPLDWRFCIPIWEQAHNPICLSGDLYLYEPSSPEWVRTLRDSEITRIMQLPPYSRRRPVIAVIGDASVDHTSFAWKVAEEVGQKLAESGFIVMTGGLSGVMEAACRGAKKGKGLTIGILPSADPKKSNPFVDVPIATGLGHIRNGIVAHAEAIVAIGGKEGTRSEIALAWSSRRLLVALQNVPGCSQNVANRVLDGRKRYPEIKEDRVFGADSAEEAVALLRFWLPHYGKFRSKL